MSGKTNIEQNYHVYFLFFIFCSLIILYPQNFTELFYYDDNTIRYMIAKLWVEGKLSREEKLFFLAYGSAEIYIPFFYFAKILKVSNYELVYNFVSLFLFLIASSLFYHSTLKKKIQGYITFPFYLIFGIVCMKKGSLHWFIASSIFMHSIISERISNKQKFLLWFAYLISPPLVISSVLFCIIFLLKWEKKRAVDLLLPFLFTFPKYVLVSEITILEVKKSLYASEKFGREVIGETKSFAPPVPSVFLRPVVLDYFDNKVLGLVVYLILARALFTEDRQSLFVFILFYVFSFVSIFIFDIWKKGAHIPDLVISILSFFFTSNPFRYIPIFVIYFVMRSEETKYDNILLVFIILSFIASGIWVLVNQKGELPAKVPDEVKLVIRYINESEAEKILVEGDTHMLEKGKLIHPLYGAHIMSYIAAEADNKKFYGGVIPWELYKYNFFAGRFKYKPIESSDILEFISKNSINLVLCWTEACEKFFWKQGKKIVKFGKIKVVELR